MLLFILFCFYFILFSFDRFVVWANTQQCPNQASGTALGLGSRVDVGGTLKVLPITGYKASKD